ncbi:MAG: DUF1501 domain-containing protein [Planctomycetota bacterium]
MRPSLEQTRRQFLGRSGFQLGGIALASLAARSGGAEAIDGMHQRPAPPTKPPKAKNVIYLQMLGGPSQLDLFDDKPKLRELHGTDVPSSLITGEPFAFIKTTKKFLGSPFKFQSHGQSGGTVSELLPHLSSVVDDLAFVKSVQTDQFNHGPAQIQLNTGFATMGKPSMGAWISYGLGNVSDNLPGYVVLVPGQRNSGGKAMWGSGFLPAKHQGVEFRVVGDPVPFVRDPVGVDGDARRDTIQAITKLDGLRLETLADPQIAGSIAAYELAFQMQASVPELVNVDTEPDHIKQLYGVSVGKNTFARSCLMARRLIERGVRFVQICYEGEPGVAIWDSHGDTKRASLEVGLPILCKQTDRATAALIMDLKQRGLLDETIVIWGGEFGRTPMNEDRPGAEKGYTGRDHWPRAGTMWLAGGGINGGITVGRTDEIGYRVVEDPVHVHDLNATVLHLLGIDHKRLTYKFQGRDFRLTDVHGRLVEKLYS